MYPDLVGVTQVIPGLKQDGLCVVSGHALHPGLLGPIVCVHRGQLLRQQGWEPVVPLPAIHLHHLVADITPDLPMMADDFALGAIQALQFFIFAIRLDDMGNARGLYMVVILVNEHSAVVGLMGRKSNRLQPVQTDLPLSCVGVSSSQQQPKKRNAHPHRYLSLCIISHRHCKKQYGYRRRRHSCRCWVRTPGAPSDNRWTWVGSERWPGARQAAAWPSAAPLRGRSAATSTPPPRLPPARPPPTAQLRALAVSPHDRAAPARWVHPACVRVPSCSDHSVCARVGAAHRRSNGKPPNPCAHRNPV